jgi:hypothetical protein
MWEIVPAITTCNKALDARRRTAGADKRISELDDAHAEPREDLDEAEVALSIGVAFWNP